MSDNTDNGGDISSGFGDEFEPPISDEKARAMLHPDVTIDTTVVHKDGDRTVIVHRREESGTLDKNHG
ncbi:hypothetical protein G7070_06200 [Propioniciclava coleopterorum]|uniref:Uncharacterized protein n=1 Tax=Propioniciclava coleopterorum TaxID=2714937 RepID=A0A6G7Y535_9ACTN|nr:hypothetical protein [Propioniciclava coleopterorum]QIK71932.1 hypothetical protein G7070_06200 [Propioniciclava coleopterorum]